LTTLGGDRKLVGSVALLGMVPPGMSGVRDYGRLLGEELARRGYDVREEWVVSEGSHWPDAIVSSVRFLRIAFSLRAGTPVIWNYSSFAYGLRGLPLAGVLLGVVLRLRGSKVVTILHEMTYPWGRRGWRGNIQAVTQSMALHPVLAGSSEVVVTIAQRADALTNRRWPGKGHVHVAPVFSTIGSPACATWRENESSNPVVGVLNYTGDGARPDVITGALARLDQSHRPSLVLLGSPGPSHPTSRRWTSLAEQAGVADKVTFSGVLSQPELRRRIEECTIVLLPNDHGPSGRRTTLSAALAHGVPTLALDGPERWQDLVVHGAIEVVTPTKEAVATVLAELLRSASRRRELGANGRAFYERHMAVELLGEVIVRLLSSQAESPR
jgi:glycosyltransferase involved in cell wall biosynthesis